MRRTFIAILGAALLAGVLPAAADHDGPHPVYLEKPVFFECVGDDTNKVQNLDSPAPWSETPPGRSVQDGAGCGVVDAALVANGQPDGGEFDAAFAGTVVGNLRNLTVEMYIFPFTSLTNPAVGDPEAWVNVWLVIDGQTVVDPAGTVVMEWEEGNSGLTQKVEFTVTGLEGQFGQEDGPGEIERDVLLTIGHDFEAEVGAWVWGTSEVPAGITFNDTTPAAVIVDA